MAIDTSDLARLREQMDAADARREKLIKESREITKRSKQAIYDLHRGDLAQAKAEITAAEAVIARLRPESANAQTGAFSGALEEYAEAKLFLHWLEKGDLLPSTQLDVSAEEYLGALSDLTGELGRHAVLRATARDKVTVQHVRDMLDAIHGELMHFDFRNGDLRRKYDAVKYNLQKAEQILYDLSLR
jgi:predicted translin family RNA/ssDNA-binding protein